MGVDSRILIKTRNGNEPNLCDVLPAGCSLIKTDDDVCEGATHEVEQSWRYYGPGYERGPWPMIAAVLMVMHASEDVETVWYFGDNHEGDAPFTPERVHEFSAHYMRVGDRPYNKSR